MNRGGIVFRKKLSFDIAKEKIWTDLQKTDPDNIVSLILYDNAGASQYLSTPTDQNLLIVTRQLEERDLLALSPLQARWARTYKLYPLVLTQNDIVTSADIFPIEFLNIKESYRLVAGGDVFKKLEIPLHHLRTQCEYNLKGKLILLRQAYLENPGKLQSLLTMSLPTFFLTFKNILKLVGEPLPANRTGILQALEKKTAIKCHVLDRIADIASGQKCYNRQEQQGYFSEFICLLGQLADFVDRFDCVT